MARTTLCSISAEELRSRLIYHPETGKFFWLERSDPACPKWWNKKFAGREAGYSDPDGRRIINIYGVLYYAHRLAWLYMTNEWPKDLVDHEDRNPGNNKWKNLRDATSSQNNANKKVNANSKTGAKGVRLRGLGQYQARISAPEGNGKTITLGVFSSKAEAEAAYAAEAKKRFGEFARIA